MGGDSDGASGGSHESHGLLLWVIGWAAAAELYSELQYRCMAARDAHRRAELFPSSASQQPLRPQQAAAAARAAAALGAPLLPANPSVSIIVPALNEEAGLPATLRYLQRELHPPAHEIIVVDGGSADRTVEVARRCGARVLVAGRGRARQMNAGAAAARGGRFGRARAPGCSGWAVLAVHHAEPLAWASRGIGWVLAVHHAGSAGCPSPHPISASGASRGGVEAPFPHRIAISPGLPGRQRAHLCARRHPPAARPAARGAGCATQAAGRAGWLPTGDW